MVGSIERVGGCGNGTNGSGLRGHRIGGTREDNKSCKAPNSNTSGSTSCNTNHHDWEGADVGLDAVFFISSVVITGVSKARIISGRSVSAFKLFDLASKGGVAGSRETRGKIRAGDVGMLASIHGVANVFGTSIGVITEECWWEITAFDRIASIAGANGVIVTDGRFSVVTMEEAIGFFNATVNCTRHAIITIIHSGADRAIKRAIIWLTGGNFDGVVGGFAV